MFHDAVPYQRIYDSRSGIAMRTVTFGLSNPVILNPGCHRQTSFGSQPNLVGQKPDQFNRTSRHVSSTRPQFRGGSATQATSAQNEAAAPERQGHHASPDTLQAYQQDIAEKVNQMSMQEVHQHLAKSGHRLHAYLDEAAGRPDPRAAQAEFRPYIAHEVILQQQLQARIRQDNLQKVVKFLMMGIALGLAIWQLIKPLFTQRQQPAASS